jgi:ribosomal protein L13
LKKLLGGCSQKNKLGSSIFKNLRVVNGEHHNFKNLKPEEFKINI